MFDHNWKILYPGVAQLVARLLWEREAGVRAAPFPNPGKRWDAKADGVLPLAGNWSENFITGCSAVGSALALGETARAVPQFHIGVLRSW